MNKQMNEKNVPTVAAEVSKLNLYQSQNQMTESEAEAPEQEKLPPIFKLKVDHFEEIFDFLELKDLHAINQTCKRLQQVTG